MKYILLFFISLVPLSSVAIAENTTYKQQILPIDCIYEVIDVGTQKLRYLTPETCPIDPGPPVITEPPISTTTDTDDPVNNKWVYYAPIEVLKPANTISSTNNNEAVKGSTETIRDVVYRNKDSMVIIATISIVWITTVVVLKKRKIIG